MKACASPDYRNKKQCRLVDKVSGKFAGTVTVSRGYRARRATTSALGHELTSLGIDEIDAAGNVKRHFWNKGAAAQMAMKHLGLYEKDNKHLGPNLALQVVLVSPPQRPPEDYEE